MNPLRWDVLVVSFVLALPVVGLWLRGEFSVEELTGRLPWCFVAGWAVVALLRWAAQPRTPTAPASASAPAEEEFPTPA
jgi:hypothetical protein